MTEVDRGCVKTLQARQQREQFSPDWSRSVVFENFHGVNRVPNEKPIYRIRARRRFHTAKTRSWPWARPDFGGHRPDAQPLIGLRDAAWVSVADDTLLRRAKQWATDRAFGSSIIAMLTPSGLQSSVLLNATDRVAEERSTTF
jgi:hypothetical protein